MANNCKFTEYVNDNDEYYSDDCENELYYKKIKDNIVSKFNDTLYIVKIPLPSFVRETKNWIYNRTINEDKVNELLEHINNKKYKSKDSIEWIPTLIYDEFADDNNYKNIIIDGQHRREACRRALHNRVISEDINIHCIVYEINYCENKNISETINLFNQINNNRPLVKIDYPDARSITLVELIKSTKELVKDPQHIIKKNGKENGRGANQPFITERELYNIFHDNNELWISLTNEEIINNIKIISKKISFVQYENIYTCNPNNHKRYTKAVNYNFWLNLKDSANYNPNKWIKFIATPEQFS
jgi:hypothetical protein